MNNISKFINSSIIEANNENILQSFLHIFTALEGIAKKTYPQIAKPGKRFKKLLSDNKDTIFAIISDGHIKAHPQCSVIFTSESGSISFEDCIYKFARCPLIHEAEFSKGLNFSQEIIFGGDGHTNFTINEKLLTSLILTAITLTRRDNKDLSYDFIINEKHIHYSDIAGNKEKHLEILFSNNSK
ncbi:hypothetical protein [Desulfovibrio psychrotolerans]|uniref:Uncharacterized protein n=1 Tax=Desulfovibrio psychrotolerans TaxID=415242 RepID=A0A7J0BV11_9BACT|nr:hypothetical protein [Desulfovibrio psychrotolerans]GFM37540.1 hypothetical protein DSM19430T_22240 [Desulfovibrio psychrotolerans]